jgi:hypothetical protein
MSTLTWPTLGSKRPGLAQKQTPPCGLHRRGNEHRHVRGTDPSATWEVIRFEGKPFLVTEAGVFVEVAVTVAGVRLSQIHPVLNGANKPIDNPTSFDINTSIQRCLVKAIALHGLGLYIYAGEDLPADADDQRQKMLDEFKAKIDASTAETLREDTKNALATFLSDTEAYESIVAHSAKRAAALGMTPKAA